MITLLPTEMVESIAHHADHADIRALVESSRFFHECLATNSFFWYRRLHEKYGIGQAAIDNFLNNMLPVAKSPFQLATLVDRMYSDDGRTLVVRMNDPTERLFLRSVVSPSRVQSLHLDSGGKGYPWVPIYRFTELRELRIDAGYDLSAITGQMDAALPAATQMRRLWIELQPATSAPTDLLHCSFLRSLGIYAPTIESLKLIDAFTTQAQRTLGGHEREQNRMAALIENIIGGLIVILSITRFPRLVDFTISDMNAHLCNDAFQRVMCRVMPALCSFSIVRNLMRARTNSLIPETGIPALTLSLQSLPTLTHLAVVDEPPHGARPTTDQHYFVTLRNYIYFCEGALQTLVLSERHVALAHAENAVATQMLLLHLYYRTAVKQMKMVSPPRRLSRDAAAMTVPEEWRLYTTVRAVVGDMRELKKVSVDIAFGYSDVPCDGTVQLHAEEGDPWVGIKAVDTNGRTLLVASVNRKTGQLGQRRHDNSTLDRVVSMVERSIVFFVEGYREYK